jgi:hypothetical protein
VCLSHDRPRYVERVTVRLYIVHPEQPRAALESSNVCADSAEYTVRRRHGADDRPDEPFS